MSWEYAAIGSGFRHLARRGGTATLESAIDALQDGRPLSGAQYRLILGRVNELRSKKTPRVSAALVDIDSKLRKLRAGGPTTRNPHVALARLDAKAKRDGIVVRTPRFGKVGIVMAGSLRRFGLGGKGWAG